LRGTADVAAQADAPDPVAKFARQVSFAEGPASDDPFGFPFFMNLLMIYLL